MSTNPAPAELLTTADVARILGVVPATVRLMERDGRLPALKTPGGQRLFTRSDVEHLAAARTERRSLQADHAARIGGGA